ERNPLESQKMETALDVVMLAPRSGLQAFAHHNPSLPRDDAAAPRITVLTSWLISSSRRDLRSLIIAPTCRIESGKPLPLRAGLISETEQAEHWSRPAGLLSI